MSELIRGIENLYENFIFRDLLSFIIPGSIVAFSLMNLISNISKTLEMIKLLPGISYIALFGLFYLIGFAIQCFAELILWPKFREILQYLNQVTEGDIEHFKTLARTIKDEEKRIKLKERYVVFKQMCRNGSFAIFFLIFTIPFKPNWLNSNEHKVIFGSLIFFAFSLLIGYGLHLKRQEMWDKILSGEININ